MKRRASAGHQADGRGEQRPPRIAAPCRAAIAGVLGGATLVLAAVPLLVASSAGATSQPTDELLTTDQAVQAGFTKLSQAAGVDTSTGVTGCPNGVQEAFEDSSAKNGLVSEAFFCNSTTAANTVLKAVGKTGSAIHGLTPPSSLGSSATARQSGSSSFGIFWRRGSVVEVIAVQTNLGSATGSTGSTGSITSTSPSTGSKTLSAHLQHVLVTAATQQNARYVDPPVSDDAKAQSQADSAAQAGGCPSNPLAALKKESWRGQPPDTIDGSKQYSATVVTDVGTFVIQLRPDLAPLTVSNFIFLADHGFYNCVIFHRVVTDFVDQTGDRTGTGSGGPGYTIRDELPLTAANPAQQYPLGAVAMANTGSPNTGGSQWFVVVGPDGESLPNSYAMFGQVASGMDVVQAINNQGSSTGKPTVIHRILKVTITTLVLTRLYAHPIVDDSPRKGVPVGSPVAVSRGVSA